MCVEWQVMIAFPVLFYQIVLIATAFHWFGEREGSYCCQMEDVLHSSHLRDSVSVGYITLCVCVGVWRFSVFLECELWQ